MLSLQPFSEYAEKDVIQCQSRKSKRTMFWRKKQAMPQDTTKKTTKPKSAQKGAEEARPKLSLLSLESRLMFDAAATATAAEVNQEQVAQEQAEAAVSGDSGTSDTQASSESDALLSAISTYMPAESRTEIVFVDPTVPNYQDLLSGLDPSIEVIMLDGGQDGIEQMAGALAGRTGIDAIHLISHGEAGALQLGTGTLNVDTMPGQYADELAVIQQALSEQADILVYGCDFAEGQAGQDAVTLLSQLTGADVAASTDDTGYAGLGGDWDLEFQVGTVEAQGAIDYDTQADWVGLLSLTASGSETRVNTTTTGTQTHNSLNDAYTPDSVAMDASGNYVSVWESAGNIYGQRYNSAGTAQGSEFIIANNAANERLASVAMNASGAFVVTWERNQGTGDYDIYARLYNSSGTAVTSEFLVNDTTTYDQEHAHVAMAADGSFVVVFESNIEASGTYYDNIYAQRYDASGTQIGSNFLVNTTTAGDQNDADIAMDAAGNFVVVWAGERTAGGSVYSIYGQRYNASGVAQGSEFLVNSVASNNDQHASVAMNDSGNFVVTWDRVSGSDADIQAQRFNSSGVAQGSAISVTNTTSYFQEISNVSMDQSGNFVVSWSSNNQDGSGWGVYTRQYDSTGTSLTTESRVATTTTNSQDYSGVAYQNGKVVVTWSGNGTGDTAGIFMQRYDAAGGNAAPTITSNGGAVTASINVAENTTAVTTVTATDTDVGATLTYSISGGADAAKFTINSSTGALSFISAPDYESPTDSGGNNVYDVIVTVKDNNGGADSQSIAVTVTDVNETVTNTVPGAQSTNEDTAKVFSSGNGNQISITDLDAGSNSIEVTLSVTNGTLTLAGTTGLTFTSGDGTTDTMMTFRGTVSAINTALNGLSYNPTADYNGSATLTITSLDNTLVSLNIDANLQARYTFEGNANDVASGTAQNGTLVNGATYVTDGTRGQVLSLDGVNDYVQISGTFSNPSEVTIGGWVNLASGTGRKEFISLSDRVHIALDDTGGVKGSIQVGASSWIDLNSNQFIAGTGWHHVMYSYSDSTNTHSLYIDGVQVATATVASSVYWTGATDTYIGRHPSNGWYPNAMIDDVRIYNRVLTATEVSTLANDQNLDDSDSIAITVSAVNDAPVLADTALTLTVAEDAGAPSGAVGSAISAFTGGITDVDSGASKGIAITGTNETNGTWYYTTNGGTTWTAVGAVSSTSALLLADNASTRLYFAPSVNYNGTSTGALTLRAWDQTSGTPGTKVTTASNGGTTAFSMVTDMIDVTVTPVNDAPVLADTALTLTVAEDAGAPSGAVGSAISAFTGGITDVDSGASKGIAITGTNETNGTWYYTTNGGTTWTAVGAVSSTSALLLADNGSTRLYFSPGANYNGTSTGALILRAWDQTSGTAGTKVTTASNGGTTAFSSATDTIDVSVTAVNDAPVITSNGGGATASVSVVENTTAVTTATSSDVDGGTAVYSIVGGADAARFSIDSSTGVLTFVAAPNYEAPADTDSNNIYEVTVQVSDGAGGTGTQTISVNVTNQLPTGHWTFDANANDSSGNNYNGTLTNGALIDTNAATNEVGAGKLSLDGSNDYVNLSAHVGAFQNLSAGTITAWVYPDTAVEGVIFEASDSGDSNSRIALIREADGSLTFFVREGSTTLLDVDTAANLLPAGTWTHVAVSVDASGNRLYINGVQVPVGNLTYTVGSSATSAFFDDVTQLDFMAWGVHKHNPDDTAYSNEFNGFMDDARVYDGPLAADDIAALANANVAPVNNLPATQQTPIDTPLVFSTANGNAISISDVDDTTVQVTLSATNGTVTLNGTSGLTFSVGDGSGDASMTFTGSLAAINSTLNGLQFSPSGGYEGMASLQVSTTDFGGPGGDTHSDVDVLTIKVGDVYNDAPVLGGANDLTTIDVDDVTNSGTLVSALLVGHVTDPDTSPVYGIAVIAVDDTNGTWEYSLDGGSNWLAFGAVSLSNARLLAADANTSVRFVPDPGWSGTVSNGITFHAWDQTSGTNGGTVELLTTHTLRDEFTTSAYSNNNGTDNWAGNWVETNDTGGATGDNVLISGGELRLDASDGSSNESIARAANLSGALSATLSFNFRTDTGVDATDRIAVETSADGGATWTLLDNITGITGATSATRSYDIGAYATANTQIRFEITSGYTGSSETFYLDNVQIQYTTGIDLGGASAFSIDSASCDITVTPINDEPTLTATGTNPMFTEDGAAVDLFSGVTASPVEAGQTLTRLDFTVSNVIDGSAERITVDGTTIQLVNGSSGTTATNGMSYTVTAAGGTATVSLTKGAGLTTAQMQMLVDGMTYQNMSQAPTVAARVVTLTRLDDSGSNSAPNDNQATLSLTSIVTVTAVNDAPVNTVPGAQTVAVDTPLAISGVSVNDVDGNLTTVQLSVMNGTLDVTLSGGATISSGASGTPTVTLTGTQADINATLSSLTYQGNSLFTGTDTLTVLSTDSNGATDSDTVQIAVSNNAPTNVLPAPQTAVEDTPLAITGLSVTDGDGNLATVQLSAVNGTLAVTLSGGATVSSGANGSNSLTLSGSQADLNATLASLIYQGNANFSGADTLTITSTDSIGTADTDNLSITVTPVNETPTDLALSANTVAENATNGTVVGTVTGTDPDTGDTKSYSFTDNAGGRFAINSSTGQITVANGSLLNYESATSHSVTVRVTDSGGLTYDETFTINLTDVNDAPTDLALSANIVAENATNGTVVGTVSGTDPDSGDTKTYSFTDSAGGRFAINSSTGQITVANSSLLNYESAMSHTVTVRVTDAGGLTYDETFMINVTDMNETPTLISLSNNTVAENAANGTVVGTASTTDPDAGDTHTYSLLDSAGGRFTIDSNTGVITVADGSLLDYDSAASHNLTIRTTDAGGLTHDQAVTINLTNVNETPTDLALSANTVAENATNGTVVGTISGTDPDSGDMRTYSFTDSAGGRFAINSSTGQITVANDSLLDYESATSHSVTVRVTDSGGLTYDETFTINLTNVNEAPTGADATITINEDTSHTLTTADFGFSDVDAGDSLSAVRIEGLPSAGTLTLSGIAVTAGQVIAASDMTAGNLVFTPAADAGGTSYANLTFSVQDSNGAYDVAPNTLTFDVTAVNDAPVNTVPGAQTVTEDMPITFTGLSVNDVDGNLSTVQLAVGNGTLWVSLAGGVTISAGANDSGTLTLSGTQAQINAALATLTYQGTLNFTGSDTLTMVSTDSAGMPLSDTDTVAITVTAVNDAPMITPIAPDVTFVEDGLAQLIDATGTITDVDSANFDGGVMTVAITQNGSADDRLLIGNFGTGPGQVGTSGSNVTYEGVVVGTFTGGSSGSDPLVITFNGSAAPAAVQEVYRSIQFDNGSHNPSTATRQITFGLTDGDGGTATPQTKLVYVQATDDAPTDLSLLGNQVAENAANGTVVGTVMGTDPDTGDTLTYSFTDSAGGRFAINSSTGQITVANGSLLNYEAATSHSLTVRVTDSSGLTYDETFTINLTDINEAPTLIGLTGTTVAENAANGTVVGTASTTDPDAGDTHTYSLLDDAGGRFAIDGNTGVITVADGSLLDYDSAASHGLTIRATDAAGLTYDQAVTINLTNVNETPTDLALSANTVAENAANGTVVGTISGTDPDAGDTKTYSFTDSAGGRFAINSSTGQITVADSSLLNYEAATSHSVTVRVTDGGGLTYDETFTINLTDINDAPTDLALSANTVAENAANGTVVGIVSGTDPDSGDTKTYSFTDSAGGRFAINSTTGEITVADGTLLDYEAATSHTVTVRVTDSGGLTYDETFAINLTDVNETPTDVALSANTVAENAANGTVVGIVSGIDPDSGDTKTYSFTDSAGGRFAINSTTGEITVADGTLLDYEAATSHTVTVRVTDSGGLTYDETFTINLTDVNEAPTGGDATVTIAEDTSYPLTTADFGFSDVDAGDSLSAVRIDSLPGAGSLTLSGVAVTAGQVLLVADITAGNLVFTPAADANGAGYASVTFSVQDSGGLSDSGPNTLTFDVTPVNDAPVNTVPGPQTVAEDTPLAISGLSVSDVDGNLSTIQLAVGNGTVSVTLSGSATISAGANGTGTLTLSGSQVDLNATLATLVYQGSLNYTGADTLTVTSTDSNAVTDVDTVAITVTAVNDATVVTGGTSGTGSEDTTLTGTLTATDAEGLSDGTVFTVTTAATNGTASIDPATGLWSYSPTADFYGTDSFTVTITDDAGTSTTQAISVTVTPVVDLTDDSLTTAEDTAISANVLTGTNGATADSFEGTPVLTGVTQGANGSVTFLADGTVTYTPNANFSGTDSFTYTITSGGVAETATVTVTVTAVNDPTVVTGGTSGTGNEDTTLTGTLTATDPDGLSDGTVFSVTTAATNGTASIDPATGLWSYQPNPDYNGTDSFTVTLTDDAGTSTTQIITLTVTAVNDAPILVTNSGSTVAEGGTDTIDASELAVTDVDNSAAQLTYTISTGPASGRLELTTAPGVTATTFTQADIAANRLVYLHNGSETTSDSFTVTVNDGAGGAIGPTTVTLTITPVNDTPTITSGGGGATAAFTVAENVSAVTIVTGADVDLPAQALTYSLSGGVDQARFTINAATGALNFIVPPDFEVATDANGDNVYVVQVQVTDNQGASTLQTIQVTVTDVVEGVAPPPPSLPVPPILLTPTPPPPSGGPTSGPETPPADEPATVSDPTTVPPGITVPPMVGSPVSMVPLTLVPSSDRPVERVPEEPRKPEEDAKDRPLFFVNDDQGRPLYSVLPVEPAPTLEPEPPETTPSVSDLLMAKLDEMAVSLEEAVNVSQERHELMARVAAVTGTTLSVGFVAWALRSGAILASMLATMPAWQHFDPLPVVKLTRNERKHRRDEATRAQQQEAAEFKGLNQVLDKAPSLKRTA